MCIGAIRISASSWSINKFTRVRVKFRVRVRVRVRFRVKFRVRHRTKQSVTIIPLH